ncbi:MAG: DUF4258 domain-containing protein [Gemmatimonadetes bacterium]|nr:DUF4258 domain-containing protein [Gemmatimonadota bacterium]
MKRVRLTPHAREQCGERGTDETEVAEAIRCGLREPAKHGRHLYLLNVAFGGQWQGRFYAVKQVAPVVAETDDEFVVITVYTFYF